MSKQQQVIGIPFQDGEHDARQLNGSLRPPATPAVWVTFRGSEGLTACLLARPLDPPAPQEMRGVIDEYSRVGYFGCTFCWGNLCIYTVYNMTDYINLALRIMEDAIFYFRSLLTPAGRRCTCTMDPIRPCSLSIHDRNNQTHRHYVRVASCDCFILRLLLGYGMEIGPGSELEHCRTGGGLK